MMLLSNFPEEKAHSLRDGLVLQMAALAGETESIQLLLSRGANVNIAGTLLAAGADAAIAHENPKSTAELLCQSIVWGNTTMVDSQCAL